MAIRTIGLTGGIASGKSAVARLVREHGVPVIDADALARIVVMPGQPALAEIRKAFGDAVIDAQGCLDRGRLGKIVFGDAEARRRLETITHPRIAEEARWRIAELAARGEPVAVYEAALLVESGLHRALDGLIVVRASDATQLRRLRERDGLDEAQARLRLAAQLPLAEKIAAADYVVDNDGSLESAARQ
ncbi:MAG: dephospho-CoA kinase, partial [Myxococcota bacterium]